MNIGVPKESVEGEKRVAIIPDTVKRLAKKGLETLVERGAGQAAQYTDKDYEAAGAKIVNSAYEADTLIKIHEPSPEETGHLRSGMTLISFLYPLLKKDLVRQIAAKGVNAFAIDMIPRTSLAQSMDVLSSQANLAGYKAVVQAAERLPKFFPMMMTAAGTIRPAKVLIVGAGVAGLQAIATAKRLGAQVEVFDVRKVVKEQVESLGARFIMVDEGEDAAAEGGYAKESSEEYKKKQAELMQQHLTKADVCITTALIPGRPAPKLVTDEMIQGMPNGAVIIDLAAPMGGNCEGTKPGEEVICHGVRIVGHANLPSTMAVHASQLISKNMEKYVLHLTGDEGLKFDMEDEITQGSLVIRNGDIVHAKVKEAMV